LFTMAERSCATVANPRMRFTSRRFSTLRTAIHRSSIATTTMRNGSIVCYPTPLETTGLSYRATSTGRPNDLAAPLSSAGQLHWRRLRRTVHRKPRRHIHTAQHVVHARINESIHNRAILHDNPETMRRGELNQSIRRHAAGNRDRAAARLERYVRFVHRSGVERGHHHTTLQVHDHELRATTADSGKEKGIRLTTGNDRPRTDLQAAAIL